ncbi:MAG: hypothetical protein GY898_11375 [Proteobacteria bacterium]|nr:hypothetical protein [Pseudomonadota bacterium]
MSEAERRTAHLAGRLLDVVDDEGPPGDDPVRRELELLAPDNWIRLDRRIRYGASLATLDRAGAGWNLDVQRVPVVRRESADGQLATAVATMHRDGHVRQAGVTLLADWLDATAYPFLLLRLGDWVPEVRTAADKGITGQVSTLGLRVLAGHLPLMERIPNIHWGCATTAIRKRLLSPHGQAVVLEFLRWGTAAQSREAGRLLFNSRPKEVVRVLARGRHVAPAMEITRWLLEADKRPLIRSLSEALSTSRHARVRLTFLQWQVDQKEPGLDGILEAARADKSKRVHDFAEGMLRV